ncbi:hypothetical protein SD81_037795 [Tolypothrix campylonemoides VB511288]|nr:hypothetical protein SD81_037795 [Tolypothrix campylonemoides VB511288]
MPDQKSPPSEMIRVPVPLIGVVRRLSKLHRQGHTIALLQALEELISNFDINALCRLKRLQRIIFKDFTLFIFSTTFQVDTGLTSLKKVSTFHR